MTNAFDTKNPVFKIDTKSMEMSARNSRIQSGVVNSKRKQGVELSLMGGTKLNAAALDPKLFHIYAKAGKK